MAGLMKSIFVPSAKPKAAKINIPAAVAPPNEAVAAEGQAEVQKNKQGRGLASTNLSGMRGMMDSYRAGKGTLGAG